jgi:hypothetical protein
MPYATSAAAVVATMGDAPLAHAGSGGSWSREGVRPARRHTYNDRETAVPIQLRTRVKGGHRRTGASPGSAGHTPACGKRWEALATGVPVPLPSLAPRGSALLTEADYICTYGLCYSTRFLCITTMLRTEWIHVRHRWCQRATCGLVCPHALRASSFPCPSRAPTYATHSGNGIASVRS